MRRVLSVLLLSLVISACSWKDVMDFVSPSKGGIDTEIVVGDKTQEVNTELGNQSAETITNVTEAPIGLYILAALGWFLPTPQGMVRMWRNRNAT